MSKQEARAKGRGKQEPYVALYNMLVDTAGNFMAFAAYHSEDFVELRIKQRAEGDWIAVAKRYAEDGGLEVAFGTGHDYVSCVLGLNGSLAANRWKADKPWEPPK